MTYSDTAHEQLSEFIKTYQNLTEKEKFGLSKVFNEATGGKLSPFNSPSPVCVGIIPIEGPDGHIGFLGVRRAIPPFVGEVALAGGFQNPNEEPVLAAIREVREETGIDINPKSMTMARMPIMAHNNNLLLFFKSSEVLSYDTFEKANENLHKTDGEASELVFITPHTPLCFPLHKGAVNAVFAEMKGTPEVEISKVFKL